MTLLSLASSLLLASSALPFWQGANAAPAPTPAETNITGTNAANDLFQKIRSGKASFDSFKLSFPPGIKQVIIDIGLLNSILTPRPMEWVVGVDASVREATKFNLHGKCAALKRCTLILAAVGDGISRFVTLWESSRVGGSANIVGTDATMWPMELAPATVPLISLKNLIDAVPDHLPIKLCKSDTNGNDVFVLKSAGSSLRRCQQICIEIIGDQTGGGPKGQYQQALTIGQEHGFSETKRSRAQQSNPGLMKKGIYNILLVPYSSSNEVKAHNRCHGL